MQRYMFRSLNIILKSISNQLKLKKYFIYDKIKKIWINHIDETIQQNTQIVNFNNNVIIIQTTTPTWKTELGFQKTELLKIINDNLKMSKPIKDIRFI